MVLFSGSQIEFPFPPVKNPSDTLFQPDEQLLLRVLFS
jgi:hypothetical protein